MMASLLLVLVFFLDCFLFVCSSICITVFFGYEDRRMDTNEYAMGVRATLQLVHRVHCPVPRYVTLLALKDSSHFFAIPPSTISTAYSVQYLLSICTYDSVQIPHLVRLNADHGIPMPTSTRLMPRYPPNVTHALSLQLPRCRHVYTSIHVPPQPQSASAVPHLTTYT
jgi:hypothetical protein